MPRTRDVASPCPEIDGDRRRLGAIRVALAGGERVNGTVEDQGDGIQQRRMDPKYKVGILGGVGRSGGEAARSRRKVSVHAAVNGEDALERGRAPLLAA